MAVHLNGHGIWYGQEESENRRIKDDEDNSIASETDMGLINLLNMVINELYHSDMPVNGIQTYVS